jgi:symplekin
LSCSRADARSKFASLWLNEEWFNDKRNGSAQFQPNLDAVLRAYLPKLDSKDKSLSAFVATLPEVPPSVIDMLETLCEESERSIVGFLALRDLIDARPPVRAQALRVLLQLCTFPDRKIRVLAISSVRRWVPGSSMSPTIIKYALGVLRRLVKQSPSPVEGEDTEMAEETKEATESGVGEVVDSKFLGEVNKDTVQQHVELAFALSRRQQDLLNDIFQLYPKMEPEIQDAVDDLFEPLIQSLGPTEKLLSILREFPQGAEKLALRVVTVLSAGGASPVLLGLLKGLMAERDLDPRFIIPIIGELDKVSSVLKPCAKRIASSVFKLTRLRARSRDRSPGSCPCSARGKEGTSSVRRLRRCCKR